MKPYLLLRLAALTGLLLLFFTDPLPARDYTASPEAVELIKAHEACSLTAYPDAQGWSIGYGHHGEDVFPGMTITQDEAERLFRVDIEKRSASVRRLIEGLPYEVEFSQGFIDALFSLVYNCGERRVRESQFYRRLRECDPRNYYDHTYGYFWAAEAVLTTAASTPAHVRRRRAEYGMMVSL